MADATARLDLARACEAGATGRAAAARGKRYRGQRPAPACRPPVPSRRRARAKRGHLPRSAAAKRARRRQLCRAGQGRVRAGKLPCAASHFRTALRLQPRNAETARQLQLVTQVRSLDPMQRGLATAERERRSAEVLRLAIEATERCLGAELTDTVRVAVDSANTAFVAEVQPSLRLRALGGIQCRDAATLPDRALDLVLAKLSDQGAATRRPTAPRAQPQV